MKHRRRNETNQYHPTQQSPHENDRLPGNENPHGRTSGDEERLPITAMIFAGGLIAWIYFGARAEAIIAVHIGVSTPLILQKLVTSVPDTKGSKNIIVTPAPTVRRFFTW